MTGWKKIFHASGNTKRARKLDISDKYTLTQKL